MENQLNFLNKKIPTSIGIIILIIIATLVGGLLVWQCQKVGAEILERYENF